MLCSLLAEVLCLSLGSGVDPWAVLVLAPVLCPVLFLPRSVVESLDRCMLLSTEVSDW